MNFFRALGRAEFFWSDLQGRLTAAKKPEQYFVGKGLGGGSTVNALFYWRPPLEDFARWGELGCQGWSGSEVLRYFRRAENDLALGDRPYHGKDGPMPVWRPARSEWKPLDRVFHEAASALGHIPARDWDFNAPGARGRRAGPSGSLASGWCCARGRSSPRPCWCAPGSGRPGCCGAWGPPRSPTGRGWDGCWTI